MKNGTSRFNLALVCGCAFVALGVWLSSGTLAPYANTVEKPKVLMPCQYLANPDHPHFEATYAMLDGQPRERWAFSVMLRRILFPLIAYLPMKALGFLVGGFVTSLAIQVATLAGFAMYARGRFGDVSGLVGIALLATYPGTYYWAGLPYPHVMIVPASIGCTIAVVEIARAENCRRVMWLAAGMGILFLSYDLAPFFVLPLLAVLMLRRKWSWVVLAVMIALAPSILVVLVLRFGARLELYNENTAPYFVILRRYFDHDVTFRAWMAHISVWPRELIKTYFWSNFVFLPALFVVVAVMQLFVRQTREARAEWGVLLSGLVLFLFNNCAPPYRGWQFHGEGVSRIYQPVVGAMMLILVRAFGEDCSLPAAALSLRNFAASRAMVALLGVTCVLNASVVLGPVTLNPMAAWIDHKFYQHAPAPQMLSNLAIYGRRPLGFCNQLIPAKPRKRRATTRATAATVPSTTSIAPAPSPGG